MVESLNIAVAKGRLVRDTLKLFNEIGIRFPDFHPDSRKLIFEDPENKIRIVLVKANDVATYVERGAADLGVLGKDTLIESGANVFEVIDLGFGRCRFVVAGLDYADLEKNKVVVATKYPRVTEKYFRDTDRLIETVYLHGSVELAPLVGLSDCIVDIVETGRTLKDNGLKVLEEISDISARLIVNKASFKTKHDEIDAFIHKVQEVVSRKGVMDE